MAFNIAEHYLEKLIPTKTFEHLDDYFEVARNTLKQSQDGHFYEWVNKVGVASSRHAFIEPEIKNGIIETLYSAIFENKCASLSYHTADSTQVKHAVIHPQGVLLRDSNMYLLCTFDGYSEVRQLAFHRIKKATLLEQEATLLKGFSVGNYVTGHHHDLNVADQIALKLRISNRQAVYVKESPLSYDQHMTPDEDGFSVLEATLLDTIQLRRWLLSITGDVEVLEPKHLRKYILGKMADQHRMYGADGY